MRNRRASKAHVGLVAGLAGVALAVPALLGPARARAQAPPCGVDNGPIRNGNGLPRVTNINLGIHALPGSNGQAGGPLDTDPFWPQASVLGVGNFGGSCGSGG